MIDQLTEILLKLAAFSTACSVLAAALPKPVSNGFIMLIHKLINYAGFNFGNAENK